MTWKLPVLPGHCPDGPLPIDPEIVAPLLVPPRLNVMVPYLHVAVTFVAVTVRLVTVSWSPDRVTATFGPPVIVSTIGSMNPVLPA